MECKNPENEQVLKFIREFEKEIINSKEPCESVVISIGIKGEGCFNGAYGDEREVILAIVTQIYEMTTNTDFSLDLNETMRIINKCIRKINNTFG